MFESPDVSPAESDKLSATPAVSDAGLPTSCNRATAARAPCAALFRLIRNRRVAIRLVGRFSDDAQSKRKNKLRILPAAGFVDGV